MEYVDGYVLAVPEANQAQYRQVAEDFAVIVKDHGALSVTECWGDDVPEGQVTSFGMAVQRQPNEVVVFSWIVWPSKEARDTGMAAAMQDPRMKHDMSTMPFDGQRMIFGGFKVLFKA